MKIVIDANVLFSALIKDSAIRKLILEYDNFFLFPEFIFEEMEKHKEELFKKSKMENKDFNKLLQIILKKVMIVPNEVLLPHKKEAAEIVKNIDPNDAVFIACVFAYPNSILWSDDKKLKKQTRIKVLNTQEIMNVL